MSARLAASEAPRSCTQSQPASSNSSSAASDHAPEELASRPRSSRRASGWRGEQAGVFLVARQELVPGLDVEAAEHDVHAVRRRVGEPDLLGRAAEEPGKQLAPTLHQRDDRLEVLVAGATVLELEPHALAGGN